MQENMCESSRIIAIIPNTSEKEKKIDQNSIPVLLMEFQREFSLSFNVKKSKV